MRGVLAISVAVVVAACGAATAAAHFGKEVRAVGTCTAGSAIGVTLDVDGGRLVILLVVDQGRGSGRWTWAISRRGRVVARGVGTTRASTGAFAVRRTFADLAGKDTISARGARGARETCRVSATI